jgi:hypothetical protein
MTLGLAPSAIRAKAELLRQYDLAPLEDFIYDSQVIHEDGSTFFVRNSFTRVWVDPLEPTVWVFLISEHSEPMYWGAGDLYSWASYRKVPTPDSVQCVSCDGIGVVPNRAFLPGGPECGCGRPSTLQSGSCGTDDCEPRCKTCAGVGWIWK